MPTPSRPTNIQVPFASAGVKNTIPVSPSGSYLASFDEGFPPVTMQSIVSGGEPPDGKDFNGILYDITTHTLWVNAGGQYQFDSALSAAMGGYPAGMVLQSNDGTSAYVSAVNNNTTDFNSTPGSIGTLWMPWAGQALKNQSIIWCGTSGGSANAQTFTPSPPVTAYVAGQTFAGKAGFTNTGSMTIDISGLGPLTVKKASPSGPVNLTGGEWVAGNDVTLKYNGTDIQLTDTDLGALAFLNAGEGIEDDGAGNARVKPADNSIRRTAAGIQTNAPESRVSTATAITSATSTGTVFIATAPVTFTQAATSTLWNGFNITIKALGGNCTFAPNAADSIDGGTPGGTYIIPNNTSVEFVTDGAGNINAVGQTNTPGASPADQYINSTQTITSGRYLVDTSAAPVSLTLPASPATGTPIILSDPFSTWSTNNVTLISGGGDNTIDGSASNFPLDVSGSQDVKIIYKSGNWSFE